MLSHCCSLGEKSPDVESEPQPANGNESRAMNKSLRRGSNAHHQERVSCARPASPTKNHHTEDPNADQVSVWAGGRIVVTGSGHSS